MEAEKRSYILDNFYPLVSATECSAGFLNFFQKAAVFTTAEVSEIDSISEPFLKAVVFYLRVIKSTLSYVHDVLIFALKQTWQISALAVLTDPVSLERKTKYMSCIEANLYALMLETTCSLNFLNIFQEAGILTTAEAFKINTLPVSEPLLKPAMFYVHLIESTTCEAYKLLLSALHQTGQVVPLYRLLDEARILREDVTKQKRPNETGSDTAKNDEPVSAQRKRTKLTANDEGDSELPSLSRRDRKTLSKSEIHELMSNTVYLDANQVAERIKKVEKLLKREGPILSPRFREEPSPLLCDLVHPQLLLFVLKKNCDARYHPTRNGLNVVNKVASYLDADGFHELVQHFADVGVPHVLQHRSSGLTALHRANFRMEVKEETIKLFEAAGVGLNDVCKMGKTPLMYAVNRPKLSLAYLIRLVEMGADPHLLNSDGHSVIHMAARKGNVDAIRYFAGVGADLRGKTEQELAVWNEAISHCAWSRLKAVLDTLRELGCEGGPFAEA